MGRHYKYLSMEFLNTHACSYQIFDCFESNIPSCTSKCSSLVVAGKREGEQCCKLVYIDGYSEAVL